MQDPMRGVVCLDSSKKIMRMRPRRLSGTRSDRVVGWRASRLCTGLAALLFGVALGVPVVADELPEPLAAIGNLPTPLDWIVPHYKNLAAPFAWNGFFASPLINYQSAEFHGLGGRLLKQAHGFTLGGEAGYNFQAGQFVLGPAADLSYSFMQAGGNGFGPLGTKADIGFVGSVRARAGYAIDRFLIYATGGLAFGEIQVKNRLNFMSSSQTTGGWTAGGGVQYLWSDAAIFQLEYRRLSLEDQNYLALPFGRSKVGVDMNLINAGFYFKF
jgi:outer membrane immunogenic protein